MQVVPPPCPPAAHADGRRRINFVKIVTNGDVTEQDARDAMDRKPISKRAMVGRGNTRDQT